MYSRIYNYSYNTLRPVITRCYEARRAKEGPGDPSNNEPRTTLFARWIPRIRVPSSRCAGYDGSGGDDVCLISDSAIKGDPGLSEKLTFT
jgi:hypothetical protein